MNPLVKFLLRLVLSIAASWFIATMYFGQVGWDQIALFAAFILIIAYMFEALRGAKKK